VTVPVAPVMTESMKRAGVVLAKIAERNPEFFDNMVWDQINKGKMSLEEAAKLLERLGSWA
jgi:polyhydroxyalkanoate synthesis regulator phasin